MATLLFLLGAVAVLTVGLAFGSTRRLNRYTARKIGQPQYVSKAVSMLIITAQVSELIRVVEHTSIVSITTALLLLAVVVATRSGTEGEGR